MKSYELQPTYDNLKETFLNDTIDRNKEIYYFVTLLNTLEENCSISLNGKWGSGKTFFVRQVKMIFDSYNEFINSPHNEDFPVIKKKFEEYKDEELDLKLHRSIYYDAWENDNDEDPILSLIYEIVKVVDSDFSFGERDIKKVVAGIAELVTGKKVTVLLEALEKENPLAEISASRNLHELIEDFFESLFAEKGDRLLIFIDELDRCKPTYAVKLLERIKHYFTNDRITFVFSINADELQHTIKQCYGNDFNSYKYLDRFFDLRVSIPPVNMQKYLTSISFNNSSHIYDIISHIVADKYNFELREISKYARLTKIAAYKVTHMNRNSFTFDDGRGYEFCLICVVPIILGLTLSDATQYRDLVEGRDSSPLLDILGSEEVYSSMCYYLFKDGEDSNRCSYSEKAADIKAKLDEVYNALFVERYTGEKYNKIIGKMEFDKRTKESLIRTVSLLSNYADYNN